MKPGEVIPSYGSNSQTPRVDLREEENLQLPMTLKAKAEEGNTLRQLLALVARQMVLASPEGQTIFAMELQITNPVKVDSSAEQRNHPWGDHPEKKPKPSKSDNIANLVQVENQLPLHQP